MKEYTTEFIRNVAMVSHSGAGKTMLAEAFLHFTGATTRLGKIEDGTTVADFEDEEIRRRISLSTAVIPVEYRDHKINLLDTPGYTDFIGEAISALRVVDGVMVMIDAVAGAEVGTEITLSYCDVFKLPRFVVINKMNRDNANFAKAMDSVHEFSSVRLVPFQLPWGEKAGFKGVLDLLTMKAYEGDGKTARDIPAELMDQVETARMELIEAAAEGEDALLEKYLEGEELTTDEILRGLVKAVQAGAFAPVFVTAGSAEIGLARLLDALVDLMPSPSQIPLAKAQGKDGEDDKAKPGIAAETHQQAQPCEHREQDDRRDEMSAQRLGRGLGKPHRFGQRSHAGRKINGRGSRHQAQDRQRDGRATDDSPGFAVPVRQRVLKKSRHQDAARHGHGQNVARQF